MTQEPRPQLSIIIPCYNCAATLQEAVESCYVQGFKLEEFEIVICDDASTDTTTEIIAKLKTQHQNIYSIHHTTNRGGGAARNSATNAAQAAVIFCLDSDDILPAGTLRKMYEYLNMNKLDGVGLHHSTKFCGEHTENVAYRDTFDYVDEIIPLESLLQRDGKRCPLYSVFLFTKAAWTHCGGYPEHHGFDTQGFAWRFLSTGQKAATCPDTDYLHRVAFHESYYLREDAAGRKNINWQSILLECKQVLEPSVVAWVTTFPAQDFTRDLLGELTQTHSKIFIADAAKHQGKFMHENTPVLPPAIPRSSWRGILLRLRARIRALSL